MSDRHLCKAKRIDNREWVEGFYFCMVHDDGRHVHHFIMPLGADLSLGMPIEKIQVEVDPSTICQCTGLKDKNGRKIFEGDIVRFKHGGKFHDKGIWYRNYVIEYVNTFCTYGLRFRNKSIHFPCKQATVSTHDVEVIGNIFDNPELLEGGAE